MVMGKRLLVLILAICPLLAAAQSHSWDGRDIPSKGKFRILNILINIIYDVHPEKDPCRNEEVIRWPEATKEGVNSSAVPNFLLQFMDTSYIPGKNKGAITRLYGESSFDMLQLTADYMVINLRESRILNEAESFTYNLIAEIAIDYVNATGGFRTVYRHNNPKDYIWDNSKRFGYTQVLFRNISATYGGINGGGGFSGKNLWEATLKTKSGDYILGANGTMQCVGAGDFFSNPSSIIKHELSHSLFGGNSFHASGGNHRGSSELMPFLSVQKGYGLMGASESGLVSCNGYERWRMHWKHPDAPDYICARNTDNSGFLRSDISKEDGAQTFLLRDFVTYGDAVRIRLPYKGNDKASNQYIWLENHQVGYNGKLDYLQYADIYDCRPKGTAGIYAYYQVGRDVLEGREQDVWNPDERDNLRIISAEGYYNFNLRFTPDTVYRINCVNYSNHNYVMVRKAANPFNGYSDQENMFFPEEGDNRLGKSSELSMWRKVVNGRADDALPSLGDNLDAFSKHTKIGMATNPSTCNTRTYYNSMTAWGSDYRENPRNLRTTFLSGLSIEMIPQKDKNILVRIRWDDYDITDDANWTGNIALKEKAFLQPRRHLLLTQNLTPEQPYRDSVTGLFARPTLLTCEAGSEFVLQSHSTMELEKGSRVLLKTGSRFEIAEKALLKIGKDCVFEVEPGAQLIVHQNGKIKNISNGKLLLHKGVKILK